MDLIRHLIVILTIWYLIDLILQPKSDVRVSKHPEQLERYEDTSHGWTGGATTTHNEPVNDDSIFYMYNSDSDKSSGLEKCQKECKGPCVPFGLTGSAWCHPCLRCQS